MEFANEDMALIQDTSTIHNTGRILYQYFEKALEDLGLKPWLSLLIPGKEEYFRDKIKNRVHTVLSFPPWEHHREDVLRQPESHVQWEPLDEPEEEIWAHYRMQWAIVATLIGDREQLKTLAAQLITEPMNRKLAISYFLGNLTEGKIGLMYKELPTQAQVMRWVREFDQIKTTYKLDQMARLRIE